MGRAFVEKPVLEGPRVYEPDITYASLAITKRNATALLLIEHKNQGWALPHTSYESMLALTSTNPNRRFTYLLLVLIFIRLDLLISKIVLHIQTF